MDSNPLENSDLNTEFQVNSQAEEEEIFLFPASFAQQRLWFIDRLVPGNTFYNVPTTLHLKGSLNQSALLQTFNQILQRHESLRTSFTEIDEQLIQVIHPSLTLSLTPLDLRKLPASQREAKAKEIIAQEIEHPFDLSKPPLLRLRLLQLEEDEYILVFNLHHIVCDDWSIGVLIAEIGKLYTAFASGEANPLPELPLQYADFAEWQRQWLQAEVLETQLAYWRQQLNNLSILHLPTDRLQPIQQNYQGTIKLIELGESLTEALEAFSQKQGATLFMTLLAAFQTLLYRYTSQADIAVGSAIANRNRSEIESLIGFFVNTLVLRTDLSGNPSFSELLARVKQVTLGAYAHQDLPFEKLVEELQPERSLNRHPLFQVMFSLQNSPMEALQLPGLTSKFMKMDLKTTRFDLEFHLWKSAKGFRNLWGDGWEDAEGIRGVIVYRTDSFEESAIARMVEHYKTLLKSIVTNPEQRLSELPLLTEAEQYQLLVEFNIAPLTPQDWGEKTASKSGGFRGYAPHTHIKERFEAQVEQTPDAIAVTFGENQLTYRELNYRSNQLAHYLQKLGVDAEAIVGICLEASVEAIVGLLGILKAGGAYLPLDPSYPCDRIGFMLEDAGVSLLITDTASRFINTTAVVVPLKEDWEIINRESRENPATNVTADNLAYIIYTSGSTGKPKGVAIPHKAVCRLVCNTNYIQFNPEDKIAQASNISFDAATFEIWGALLNGCQLVGVSREIVLSPQNFAAYINETGISILFLTTALFQQMARTVPQAFASLRYLLFGGETVNPRWVKKVLQQGSPQYLLHVYGPTENTTFSCYYWVNEPNRDIQSTIPIGRPINQTQIYILDSNLNPVPIGIPGDLYLGGEGLARGYINRPQLTTERFIEFSLPPTNSTCRIYQTGDRARYLPDGNVEFLGRIDNQVKIRGFRIELGEIETLLGQHPGVREAVVSLIEDIPEEKQLVAYIIPTEKQEQIKPLELRQFLKQKLPDYMIPAAYILLESLPLTPNGKVNRHALPQPDTLTFEIEENYVAPRTTVEERLVQIWAKVLGKQQIGVHDNFFDLGGHSLLATQVTSRIRNTFEVEIPVRQLFETPTVGSLAKYIETLCWATQSPNPSKSKANEREEVEF